MCVHVHVISVSHYVNIEVLTKLHKLYQSLYRSRGTNFSMFAFLQMAMSPVFRAMFESNMKESSTQEVTITDFPGQAVEAFIKFFYSHHFSQDELETSACDLLGLADKYQVEEVEQHLVSSLPKFVNCKNVIPLVLSADKYGAVHVKMICVQYMVMNERELTKNVRCLIESLPHNILVEYFRAHCKK